MLGVQLEPATHTMVAALRLGTKKKKKISHSILTRAVRPNAKLIT